MSFRDTITNMMISNVQGFERAVARDDDSLASKRAERENTVTALAEALAADVPDEELITALRARRQQLTTDIDERVEARAIHVGKLDAAREAEEAKAHAAERAAERKAAETRNRSFVQGVGEVERAVEKLHALLPQIHEARQEAIEAAERLETLAGYSVFAIDDMILNSGPGYALGAIIHPYSYDPNAEHQQLDTTFAAMAANVKDAFTLAIGLREPAPPSPEELAADAARQAEQDEAERAAAEHQYRIENDRAYYQKQFPETGVAIVPPGTEVAENARRAMERTDAEATRRIKSQGM